MRHFEDLTNSEVAHELELKPTAASNRYVRALQRLRNVLDSAFTASNDHAEMDHRDG